jgi:hypothetical protein
MRTKLIMHQSTWNYINANYDKYNINVHISGHGIQLYGYEVVIDNNTCTETINEPDGYMFPKEKFVTYEPSDREWCEPLGIGRMGRGFRPGSIFRMNDDSGFLDSFFLSNKKRSTIFNPFEERFKK